MKDKEIAHLQSMKLTFGQKRRFMSNICRKKDFSGVYKNGNEIQAKFELKSKQSKCYNVVTVSNN